MELTDNILLCGRSIQNASRGYDGQLAELLLFDDTLSAAQIEALYWLDAVRGSFSYELLLAKQNVFRSWPDRLQAGPRRPKNIVGFLSSDK